MNRIVTALILPFLALTHGQAATTSPLYARGYTVMPEPQVVKLSGSDFVFGDGWKLEGQGARTDDVAIETLKEELSRRFRLTLKGTGDAAVRLIMAPNSVAVGPAQDRNREALAQQAYKIDLAPGAVTITG